MYAALRISSPTRRSKSIPRSATCKPPRPPSGPSPPRTSIRPRGAVGGVQYPRVPYTEDTDINDDDGKISVGADEPELRLLRGGAQGLHVQRAVHGRKRAVDATVAEVMAGTGPGGGGNVTAEPRTPRAAPWSTSRRLRRLSPTRRLRRPGLSKAEDKATVDGVDLRKQTTVVKLAFDASRKAQRRGIPRLTARPEKLEVTAKLDEAGHVYFVVIADGDTATVDEVIAGVDYGGVTVVRRHGVSSDGARTRE